MERRQKRFCLGWESQPRDFQGTGNLAESNLYASETLEVPCDEISGVKKPPLIGDVTSTILYSTYSTLHLYRLYTEQILGFDSAESTEKEKHRPRPSESCLLPGKSRSGRQQRIAGHLRQPRPCGSMRRPGGGGVTRRWWRRWWRWSFG